MSVCTTWTRNGNRRRTTRRWPAATAAAALLIAAGVLAIAIAGIVMLRAAQQSRAVRAQAHELCLRGRLALDDPTSGSAGTALELFEKAIASDPAYALPHAGVAEVYLQKPSSIPGVPPDVAFSRAQYAVERALALNESQQEAHLAAAKLRMTARDWPAAGHAYRRAIELAPDSSMARQQYAMWFSYQGRFEEAVREARLGESLDPLSPRALNTVAEVLRHARRFDEAIVQAQRALELNPNFGRAHIVLAHCYLGQGKRETAIEAYRRSANADGNLGHAYGLVGRIGEARQILKSLERRYAVSRVSPGEIAQVYIGLGEIERAFEWLSRAVEDGSVWTLKVAVVWDPLRSDPRFEQLVRRSGYGD